ncbi:hypothetical protein GCM10007352_24000 [Mucilaginibacter phyllosphaerae]|nr:hypothetical protein GCM10007352_24000 [Mucilaginibacter phyllosphaerae]
MPQEPVSAFIEIYGEGKNVYQIAFGEVKWFEILPDQDKACVQKKYRKDPDGAPDVKST